MADYDAHRWNMATRHVEQWDTSRLVLKPGRAKRTREQITIKHCAEGWLCNNGFPREQACNSIFDLDRETYSALHEGMHVVWRVERWQGRRGVISYYCDAHMPDEYRALTAESHGRRWSR